MLVAPDGKIVLAGSANLLAAVAYALPYVVGRGLRWSIGLGAAMIAAVP